MSQELVMIVEDDPDIRETLKFILESEDYLVLAAENGLDALEQLKNQKYPPRLILLDLMMPVMNGEVFLQRFSEDLPESYSKTKIIVISAVNRVEIDHSKVNGVLKKPLDLELLLKTIAENCRTQIAAEN